MKVLEPTTFILAFLRFAIADGAQTIEWRSRLPILIRLPSISLGLPPDFRSRLHTAASQEWAVRPAGRLHWEG